MSAPPKGRRVRRRRLPLLVAATTVGAGLALAPHAGHAAEGPAPAPAERTVLADVHTDAVSTFWQDGGLVLASRADTPATATRYEADDVWFHVDQDARLDSLPSGYEFVAPGGSTIWLAPETQDHATIWPGFSTEPVPAGVLDGNQVTLTLEDVAGPGDVELWTSGVFGGVGQRLWSSDEQSFRSFTRSVGVHMHANWAFTEPGRYDLTVRASAAAGGAAVEDTATYTFVVGDLPEAVATSTTLSSSASEITLGQPVRLDATVSPGTVDGHVEFRDGTTVLGHARLESGEASLTTSGLTLGSHGLTAHFVPAVTNLAEASASAPVTLVVTDGSGVPFGIQGVEDSYAVGDALQARIVGHTLGDGESYRWLIRPVGATNSYVFAGTGSAAAQGVIEQELDRAFHDYEISAQLRSGSTNVAQTPWVALSVANAAEPITGTFPAGDHYLGEDVVVGLAGRDLAEGESVRLAYRGSYSPWYSLGDVSEHVGDSLVLRAQFAMEDQEFAVQVVREGLVVAQSPTFRGTIKQRETEVEGMQAVYRVGQTIRATAEVYPPMDGLTYQWSLVDPTTYEVDVLTEGTDAAARSVELPASLDLHDKTLYFQATRDFGTHTVTVGGASFPLKISDTTPDTQLLFFQNLGGHYHQGGDVNLNLVADPALADGDAISWEWRWPGTDEWVALPGATGLSHALVAEQALDGVQVRGILTFADSGETLTADPVTIHVDDHGAPPRQQLTVTGETSYDERDGVTLTAQVSHPTVLDSFRWERRAAGDEEFSTVAGADAAALSFDATAADDGAAYRVSVTKPDGSVAYGPSTPVVLEVGKAAAEPVATQVSVAPAQQVYGQPATMSVSVSPAATGSITLTAGDRTVSAELVGGTATAVVPAKALAPGSQTVSVAYAGAPGRFEPSRGEATITVTRAVPTVQVKRATSKVAAGKVAVVKVRVSAAGVRPTGKVTVRVAGTTRTVKLDDAGRATVRIRIDQGLAPGRKKIAVNYRGDRYVAAGRARPVTLRVTR